MFIPFWILAKYVSFIRRCLHNEYLSTLFTRKPIQWNLELTGEPLCNEVFDITNDFLYLSNSEIYEEEPRYNDKFVSPLPLR